jgi:FkbM family methyltransferase
MQTVQGGPFTFRIARWMRRSKIKGGGALMRYLERSGGLNVLARYDLDKVSINVPLWKLQWDFVDVANYEQQLMDEFAAAVSPLHDVTLFDCGADIGTFSTLLCARSSRIARIVAFEPNDEVQDYLKANLAGLPVKSDLLAKAVGSREGRGQLACPSYNPTDHARFLVPGEGPIEITTIDSVGIRGGDIAIKIDLEGGEMEALKGASATIKAARECVIALEANPDVVKRTGQDPGECLRFLQSLRPFNFKIAETGARPSLTSPLLSKESSDLWNVICWTHSSAN